MSEYREKKCLFGDKYIEHRNANGNIDFNNHLQKQLGFLQRSCDSYDSGFHDEAIRIATVLRVLIHNTKRSTSLLQHLNATTINILTTCKDISPKAIWAFGMGQMTISSNGASYHPSLDDTYEKEYVPVSKWWDQVVFVLNPETKLTRKKIVLAASNKDGGAHIDTKLSPDYSELAKEGIMGSFVYVAAGKESKTDIQNAHLVALRQMAHEILNSPELLAI